MLNATGCGKLQEKMNGGIMAWEYKGFAIELVGERFTATVEGKHLHSSSLAGAKKAINKCQQQKAQEVPINLPVVMADVKNERPVFQSGVITGLDPDSLCVKGTGVGRLSWHRANVAPDCEFARKLFADYKAKERAYEEAQSLWNEVTFSVYYSANRRSKDTYAASIVDIQERYKAALESLKKIEKKQKGR